MSREQRRASSEQPDEAAAAAGPDSPARHFEAALRLFKAGRLAEAEQSGRQALALDSGHADSLHLMGLLAFAAAQYDLAIEWFALAIRNNPAVADYFSNLGIVLQRQGRFEEAIKSYDRALVLRPDWAEVWFRLGELLRHEKRIEEAVLSFDQALKAKPDDLDAAAAAGALYLETGRYDEAIARFARAAELDPSHARAINMVGICYFRLKRYEEALVHCARAAALDPGNAEFVKNVGLLKLKLGCHDEALAWLDRAIALRLDFASAFNDRSTALAQLHRWEEALADLGRAIEIDPTCADYRWNLALLQLLLGDFEAGWAGRECRQQVAVLGFVDRKFKEPLWLGEEPLEGKTVLLHSDEGLGDTIQYCRYASMVAARGARVVLEVEAPLHPLLAGLEGVSQCLPKIAGVELPAFDLHCPISSLPLAFKTRLETIPAPRAYLAPPRSHVREWQARLGTHDHLRVGLVWSGNPLHGNDRSRSTSLQAMSMILDVGARFYSLQKEPREADKVLLARTGIIDCTAHLADFAETAALISCLDLVVSVDTSVAHLAAATGCRTWVLLPYTPDYRWLLGRDDSPWYPSVRLFRQDASRDYAKVLAHLREELQNGVAAFKA